MEVEDSTANDWKDSGNKKFAAKPPNYQGAIDDYTKAIELDGTVATYYGNRAACYLALGLPNKALQDCNKALEIDKTFYKCLFRRAQAHLQLGQIQEAKEDFEKVRVFEPSQQTAVHEKLNLISRYEQLMKRGHEFLEQANYESAKNNFEAVLGFAPCSRDAKLALGEALLGLKKYTESATLASQLLQDDSEDTGALLLRAKSFYLKGEPWTTVSPFLMNILTLDPDNKAAADLRRKGKAINTLKEQGNDNFRNQNYDEAIKLYKEALELDPQNVLFNAQLLYNCAVIKNKMGENRESVKLLDQSLENNPDYTKAYKLRASVNTALKEYQDAVRDYHEASTREPDSRELKDALKQAQKQLKESEKKDYYAILDVPRNATEHEISKKYKKMAMLYHPDRHATKSEDEKKEAAKKMQDVNEANDVLSDAKKRQRYDQGADDLDGMDMGDFGGFSHMFRQGGFGGGHGHGGFQGGFPGGSFHFG
jgi:DnaJ family protein C protein 7